MFDTFKIKITNFFPKNNWFIQQIVPILLGKYAPMENMMFFKDRNKKITLLSVLQD